MATKYTFHFTDDTKAEFSVYPYSSNGVLTPDSNTFIPQAVSAKTDLKIYGKGMQDYGEGIQQNLIYLLENFADESAPLRPLEGQLWYKNTPSGSPEIGKELNIYNGATWDAVLLTTGTSQMTGELLLAGDPSSALGAVPKQYVDIHTSDMNIHLTANQNALLDSLGSPLTLANAINALDGLNTGSPEGSITLQNQIDGKVAKIGDTMTGNLIMSGSDIIISGGTITFSGSPAAGAVEGLALPINSTDAANKGYVDAFVLSGVGGDGRLTNVQFISPGSPEDVIVTSQTSVRFTVSYPAGSPTAPDTLIEIDGVSRVGHQHNADEIIYYAGSPFVPFSNVQQKLDSLDLLKAPLNSPTFTGTVNMFSTLNVTGAASFSNIVTGNTPTAANHLATKQYVDSEIASSVTIPVLTITRTLETLGSPLTTPTPYKAQLHIVDDNKLAISINGIKQYAHTHAKQNILFYTNLIDINYTGLDMGTLYDFGISIDGGSPITVVTVNAGSPEPSLTSFVELASAIDTAMAAGSPIYAKATFSILDLITEGRATFTTYSSGSSSSISIVDPGTANTYLFANDPSPDPIVAADFFSNPAVGSPTGSPLPIPDNIIISGNVSADYPAGRSFTIIGSNDSFYGTYDGVYRVHDNGPVVAGSPQQTYIPIALLSNSSINTALFPSYTPGFSPDNVPMTGSPAQFGTVYLTTLGGFNQVEAAIAGVGGDYRETDSLGNLLPVGNNSEYVIFEDTIPSGSTIETLKYS